MRTVYYIFIDFGLRKLKKVDNHEIAALKYQKICKFWPIFVKKREKKQKKRFDNHKNYAIINPTLTLIYC
jgi:hypothetical protein